MAVRPQGPSVHHRQTHPAAPRPLWASEGRVVEPEFEFYAGLTQSNESLRFELGEVRAAYQRDAAAWQANYDELKNHYQRYSSAAMTETVMAPPPAPAPAPHEFESSDGGVVGAM